MQGRKLGNYEIVEKLGEGGMGEVWRARDARLNRSVAVKVLPSEFAGDPARRSRFEQEARALGALNHPNIVAIYDVGQSEGQAYLVSELVEGESLRKVIDRGAVAGRKLVDIAVQSAEAIAAAHALGIVHRDLKPENIMLTREGRVKVLDFGLAKQSVAAAQRAEAETVALSQPGMVFGTVGYMAPEQVRGEPVDARSDIFSLGCVLYELATGRRAFEGKSAADVMSAILREDPPEMTGSGVTAPAPLESIVRRCLEKEPAQRFQSAADLAFALRSTTSAVSSPSSSTKAVRPRANWKPAAAAAIGAVVLFAGGYFLRARLSPRVQPEFHRITFNEGRVTSARFTPDAQNVVYSASWEGGPERIYLATPGNPEARDLGISDAELLSVSSKGDMAFLVGPFSPDGSGTLARSAIAGGQSRQVLEKVLLADWSPDGSELAVVRKVGTKARIEYPLGKVLFETDWPPFSLRVSPDGQHVAVTHYTKGSRIGLLLFDRKGTMQVLGDLSGHTSGVSASPLYWARDGSEIWYRSFDSSDQNTIYAMDMHGKSRVVARFPGEVRLFDVADDGRVLMSTESGRKGIRGAAPGETTERDLSCLESSDLKGISEDGSVIVADVLGESGGPKGSIYLRKTDGSPAVRLGDGSALAISPDGKFVTGYPSRESATKQFELMPTGPGEIKPTPKGIVMGWLSGDQNYLLATDGGSRGTVQFCAWDARTDKMRAVSPKGMPQARPIVSPDRRFYLAQSPEHRWSVYSVDTGEGRPVPGLTEHDLPINWRADGRALYIATHHDMNQMIPVSVIDSVSGNRTAWKMLHPTIPVDALANLQITPDGRAYAYNYTFMRSELYVALGIR